MPEHITPKIDQLQTKIKEARIPVQILETEDRAKVAIVFERINRKGVELDTSQYMFDPVMKTITPKKEFILINLHQSTVR